MPLIAPKTTATRYKRVNEENLASVNDDLASERFSEIVTDAESSGERIDKFLSGEEGITRSAAVKLVEEGRVLVDGKTVAKNYKLRGGETVTVEYPEAEDTDAIPQNIPLDIVYEDDDIIVINKPSGMVVHPAPGNPKGTLVNALLYHCGASLSGIGGVARPGIVHRIDKDTSGLLVVAKNDRAHLSLSGQLKDHSVSRIYYAVVCGNIKEDNGTVDAPIGRNPNDRKKMAVIRDVSNKSARQAITHYTVLERYPGFNLIKCKLETGRTHQIRVHMASIGHPILGDPVYGGEGTNFARANKEILSGQCLHAKELHLIHPTSGKDMIFECELPENLKKVIEKLRKLA